MFSQTHVVQLYKQLSVTCDRLYTCSTHRDRHALPEVSSVQDPTKSNFEQGKKKYIGSHGALKQRSSLGGIIVSQVVCDETGSSAQEQFLKKAENSSVKYRIQTSQQPARTHMTRQL